MLVDRTRTEYEPKSFAEPVCQDLPATTMSARIQTGATFPTLVFLSARDRLRKAARIVSDINPDQLFSFYAGNMT